MRTPLRATIPTGRLDQFVRCGPSNASCSLARPASSSAAAKAWAAATIRAVAAVAAAGAADAGCRWAGKPADRGTSTPRQAIVPRATATRMGDLRSRNVAEYTRPQLVDKGRHRPGSRAPRTPRRRGRCCDIRSDHDPTCRVVPDAGAVVDGGSRRRRAGATNPAGRASRPNGAAHPTRPAGRPRPADAGGAGHRPDADDGGAARRRAGDAEEAAPGAGAGQGRRLHPRLDPARGAHHRSHGPEDRRLDDGHLLRPVGRNRGEPQGLRRHLPRQHHRHLPRRSGQRDRHCRAPQGAHGLHPQRQGSRRDSRRYRLVPRQRAGRGARRGACRHASAHGRRCAVVARVQQDDQRLLQVALELPDADRREGRGSHSPDQRAVHLGGPVGRGARRGPSRSSTRSTPSTRPPTCARARASSRASTTRRCRPR